MTYCKTPESAIETSINQNILTRWQGDPAALIQWAEEQGYQTNSVEFTEQIGGDEFRVVDVWGWTDETPEDEQDWRVYVEAPANVEN